MTSSLVGPADTSALYVALRIPVAVIADVDLFAKPEQLRRVLTSLNYADTESVLAEAQRLVARIRALPPSISPDDARRRILATLRDDLDWTTADDEALKRQLSELSNELDRTRRLKSVADLPEDIRGSLGELIQKVRNAGLFIVPVGELERWLQAYGLGVSRQKKAAWAIEAATLIRRSAPQSDDVWEFIRDVGRYLRDRLVAFAT